MRYEAQSLGRCQSGSEEGLIMRALMTTAQGARTFSEMLINTSHSLSGA